MTRRALVAAAAIAALSCGSEPRVNLDFSRREAAPRPDAAREASLRIAIGAMISPEGTYRSYAGLAAFVARHAGRRPRIVQRRTYAELNRLLVDGEVDVALICTGAYVAVRDRVQFLAAPVVAGSATYRSLVVVRRGGATTMSALRGKRFAFTDELSNTGRVFPEQRVRRVFGMAPADFFSEVVFSGGHDESIGLVLDGVVDGAAVDSLVLQSYRRAHSAGAAELDVIDRSRPFGTPPFVARGDLDPALTERIRAALLALGRDPESRAMLEPTGIEGFTTDVDYTSAIEAAQGILPTRDVVP